MTQQIKVLSRGELTPASCPLTFPCTMVCTQKINKSKKKSDCKIFSSPIYIVCPRANSNSTYHKHPKQNQHTNLSL